MHSAILYFIPFLAYTSKSTTEKSGRIIKINGMCPSRLICTVYNNGIVSVTFWKTHVGHDDELRCHHPTTSEKNVIVEKLPIDRIFKDVRQVNGPKPPRINKIRPIAPFIRNVEIEENSIINSENKEISHILLENHVDTTTQQIDEEMTKKTIWDHLTNVVFTLDPDEFISLTNRFYEMAKEELSKNEPVNKGKVNTNVFFHK